MIKSQKSETSVRLAAMNLLAYREHSRAELRAKLREREYDDHEIESALDKLEQEHLLDDARFAEAYVRMRSHKGFGPVRISQELAERGINRGLINTSLGNSELDWFDLALSVRQKKAGLSAIRDFNERAKLSKFLAYRGFLPDQIDYALEGRNTD